MIFRLVRDDIFLELDRIIYYFYAIGELGFTDILAENTELVLCSKNQVLISYYLSIHLFSEQDINTLKNNTDEAYWFQNYHLILYSDEMMANMDENIKRYLVPNYAEKQRQKESYINFYKRNLESNIAIIRDIDSTYEEISEYLNLKIEESRAKFQDQGED